MPKSLPSTASRLCLGSIGSAKMASSDSASRSRGPLRSTGVSFEPSGIQTLVTQASPGASPIAAPIRRQAMPCSIQNRRMPASGWARVKPSAALRVGEEGGVEVHPDPLRLRPVDPAAEVLGLERVALDLLAAGLGVAGVEVEPVRAGDQRQGLVEVGPELVRRAGLAGIVAGDGQAAADRLARCSRTRRRRPPASSAARWRRPRAGEHRSTSTPIAW